VQAWLSMGLGHVYRDWLHLPRAHLAGWPVALQVGLGVLLSDFLAWLHHFVRHKVPALWSLHAVHHSQPHLNPLTNERYHVVEYLVAETIRFLPMFALNFKLGHIVGYGLFTTWYSRLYHANIRSRFGPLRYLLVTPQSHRIHHSLSPEHRDQNFGVLLCVWDRLFGTQHPDDESYPETGIDDAAFPLERGWGSVATLRAFVAQQIYPIKDMLRSMRRG
jgi:sterol desaturase/sphingolipid hydroxylase (fatty acid hydroxylase superfamily)